VASVRARATGLAIERCHRETLLGCNVFALFRMDVRFRAKGAKALNYGQILRALVLLGVANGAPVIARRLLGDSAASPVDFNGKFFDGMPIFGPSKSIQGIVAAIVATACVAPALQLPWGVGAVTAAACMAGDLFSSFVKRRLGMQSSSRAIGLDQVPEALFGALAAQFALPLTMADIAAVTLAFFIGQIVLSRIFFAIGLRQHPF